MVLLCASDSSAAVVLLYQHWLFWNSQKSLHSNINVNQNT